MQVIVLNKGGQENATETFYLMAAIYTFIYYLYTPSLGVIPGANERCIAERISFTIY